MAKPGWDRLAYRLVLGGFLVLALSSILAGQTSWDEETDYLGIREQIAHGVRLLRGEPTDYRGIHSNLEYYGIAGLLPAWLLWFLQRSLITGRFSLDRALFNPAVEHQLTGFFAISHAVLMVEMVLLSLVMVAIAKRMPLRQPWLVGALILITPTLLGHSFTNTKDVPFALFYSLFTLGLILRSQGPVGLRWGVPPGRGTWLALLGATLMVNQKIVALLPVVISEGMLLIRGRLREPERQGEGRTSAARSLGRLLLLAFSALALPMVALAGGLLLQPASWGQSPLGFLSEAFATFAVHSWGGCMWFDGSCVGVADPAWSAGHYMLRWLPAKLPLLLLILPLVQVIAWVPQALGPHREQGTAADGAILLGLQLLLIPTLAALRNSNLYDADRHLLFMVPPLAVFAVMGFERLQTLPTARPPWRGPRVWALGLVTLLVVGQVLDDLLLHPYQLAYFNEIARHRLNHTNTAVEYWSVSAKEAVQQAQLRGRLPLNPTVVDSPLPTPFFIGFRQLGGRMAASADTRLVFQVRSPPDFQQSPPSTWMCTKPAEVSRRQLLAPRLVMSRLFVCRAT